MAKIRVTKQFGFEMSHALLNYDGLCRNIHGHSYKLQITVAGEPMQAPGSPKDGMVIDFSILKRLIQEQIISKLDHSLMINEDAPTDKLDALGTNVRTPPCGTLSTHFRKYGRVYCRKSETAFA